MPENQKIYYDWVLKNGRSFTDKDRNKDKEKELIKQNHPHNQKECFFNSQMLPTVNKDFEYYEGWYITENLPIPLEHEFIMYNGKIIDVTVNSRFKVIEYFGVKIPTKFVCIRILKNRRSESMLFWYWKENFLDRKH